MTETNEKHSSIPKYFMAIAIAALLWNAMGVFQFFSLVLMGDDSIAQLPADQAKFISKYPIWLKVVFGLAVFPGLIGAIGLLVKKEFATLAFLVSLIAVILQQGYLVFFTESREIFSFFPSTILPFFIMLFAAGLYYWSMKGISRGWLTE